MTIVQVFRLAIGEERKAQKLYREAADKATDEEIKAMFDQLMRDEIGHEKLLREKLKMVEKIGEYTSEYDSAKGKRREEG